MRNQAILVAIALIAIAGAILGYQEIKTNQPVACTSEAKICPDGTAVGRTGPNCEFEECPIIKTEEQQAQQSLEQFFSLLNQKKYSEALAFFEPKGGWNDMGLFVEENQRNDKVAIISRYCDAVQTCLNVKVLETKKLADGDYSFKVNFIKSDGSVFVAGPCCGETEETSPSVKEFDYEVKKINGTYKVITPPLYRP